MKESFHSLRTRRSDGRAPTGRRGTWAILLLLLLMGSALLTTKSRTVLAEDASDELESLMEGDELPAEDEAESFEEVVEGDEGEFLEEDVADSGGEIEEFEEVPERDTAAQDDELGELLSDEEETEIDGEDMEIRSALKDDDEAVEGVADEDSEIDALLEDELAESNDKATMQAEAGPAEEVESFDNLEQPAEEAQVYGEDGDQPISTGRAVVAGLDFKMNGAKSDVIVTFSGRPRYEKTDSPEANQIVYLFQETEAPDKFQRAYDTREFQSPVGLFTLLQLPENPPSTKLIIQLREPAVPSVAWRGGKFVITFPRPKNKYESPGTPSALSPSALAAQAGPNNYIEENIYAIDRVFTGRPIERLEIKDSEIQDVLRLIAKTSGYNIVIGEDVKGKVGTLSLENIPWDQAFTLVLQSKRLGYIRQGNVLRVATLANLKSEKDAAVANEKAKLQVQSLRTVLIPVSYADSAELATRARPFLTDRGKIDTDSRTNTVIVRDIKSVTERIQKLLAALDTQPPRVSISAKIVEMSETFARQIGFNSFALGGNISGIDIDNTFIGNVDGSNRTVISAPQFANLQMDFQLGQLENKVRVLANPQVTAVNNQKATITQSLTQFLQESVTAGGAQTTTFKEIKANLSLDVTPIVSGDGSVFMRVVVTNEVPSGLGAEKQIDTRQVSTQVLVENGDTAVIGGVYKTQRTNAAQGIPWLMKIPIVGFFVSGHTEEEIRTEVLVFLTPKILNAEESFKRTL